MSYRLAHISAPGAIPVRLARNDRHLFRFFLIIALLGVLLPVTPGARATELAIITADQTATIDFPRSITFELQIELPSPISSAELRYSTTGMSYSNSAIARFPETTTVDIQHRVDAQIDYIEPGVDITYYWILGELDHPIARTEEQTVTWIDPSFDWQRSESNDVQLYTYDHDGEFDSYMLQTAQESVDRFKNLYDIDNIDPVRIWIYANNGDFAGTLRQNSESWIGGFSLPEAGVIAVPIAPGDDFAVKRVITHEVSHHVLFQATENPFTYPPTWLDEGLAVVGQTAGNQQDLQLVLDSYANGSLPTLRTLASNFPTDPAAATRSYATSHIVVQYLIDTWGVGAVTELVQQFRTSATTDRALDAVLGIDTEGLDSEFRAWLDRQL